MVAPVRHGFGPIAAALKMGLERGPEWKPVKCSSSWCRFMLALDREKERGTCDECHERPARIERDRAAKLDAIPTKYRWARLETPLVPPDGPVAIVSDASRAAAASWLSRGLQVLTIVGKELCDGSAPTGVGKSSLAGAVVYGAISRGMRVLWIRAAELGPMAKFEHQREVLDRVQSRKFGLVCVDGLGKELAHAKPDSGVITQRIPAMQELIALTYELPETRFVFTCDITGKMLRDSYGGDAVRRIAKAPNAVVLELENGE